MDGEESTRDQHESRSHLFIAGTVHKIARAINGRKTDENVLRYKDGTGTEKEKDKSNSPKQKEEKEERQGIKKGRIY